MNLSKHFPFTASQFSVNFKIFIEMAPFHHPKQKSKLGPDLDSDNLLLLNYDREQIKSRFSQHHAATRSGGRKSRNPFFLFLRDFRASNAALSATEVISRGAREWRQASAELKLRYYMQSSRVKRRPRRSPKPRRKVSHSPTTKGKGDQGRSNQSDKGDAQNRSRERSPTPWYISWDANKRWSKFHSQLRSLYIFWCIELTHISSILSLLDCSLCDDSLKNMKAKKINTLRNRARCCK